MIYIYHYFGLYIRTETLKTFKIFHKWVYYMLMKMFLWEILFKAKNFNEIFTYLFNVQQWERTEFLHLFLHSVSSSMLFCVPECSVMSDSATPWTAAHQALLPTEIFQARIMKWVAISYYTGSSQLRDGTHVSCIGRRILYHLSHQVIPHALLVNVYEENWVSSDM